MIQCDVCNVWQHGKCMGICRRRVPEVYKCEECSPRVLKLSKTQARQIQLKVLAEQRREKEKEIRQKTKRSYTRKMFTSMTGINEYETSDYKLVHIQGDFATLEALRSGAGVSVMYVTTVSMGLVSTRSYVNGEAVIYVCGRVSLPSECVGRKNPGTIIPFVTLYSDLVPEGANESIPICIDARNFGTNARFARMSCRPNISLRHFFLNGRLHIIGIAAEDIERGEEITVPFDADYFMSKEKLNCACAGEDEDGEIRDEAENVVSSDFMVFW
ncbi:unnamed protein product [Thelazia callipaeda]|uniref:SET domain-containing protein n=1 Tax=Thelazia callipaeda TaxID=103827 RepID=A0A0N5CRW0_THECL|nr:unnamed protein product [Thelazia callipaeda]